MIKKKKGKISSLPYLLLIPAIALLITFSFYPFIKTIVSAFSITTETGQWIRWNGLENWKMVLDDGQLGKVVGVTFKFAALNMLFTFCGALVLALVADGAKKGGRLIQTLFALPMVIATSPTSVIWKFIFRKEGGILNAILGTDNAWLLETGTALMCVAIVTSWTHMASSFILLLAGFRNVSNDLIEAATIDGASRFTIATKIKLPIASPQIFYVMFLNLVTAFKTFTQIKLLTGGGPAGKTTTLMYIIYQKGTGAGFFEIACCYSIILFLIIFVMTRIQFACEKKFVHYQ